MFTRSLIIFISYMLQIYANILNKQYENQNVDKNQLYKIYYSQTQDKTKFVDVFLEYIKNFGEIIVYEEESHFRGSLFGKELPPGITLITPKENQTTASDGSTIEVKLHQDMSMLENAPKYTFLMGIQEHPEKDVYTYIVSNQELYNLLTDRCKLCLQKEIFLQNKPSSYPKDRYFEPRNRSLIVMNKKEGPILKLRATDTNEIEPTTIEGKECYQELKEKRDFAAVSLSVKILLNNGKILALDNHRTVHTRDSFVANFGKNQINRMLLRAYVNPYSLDSLDNRTKHMMLRYYESLNPVIMEIEMIVTIGLKDKDIMIIDNTRDTQKYTWNSDKCLDTSSTEGCRCHTWTSRSWLDLRC